MENRKRKITDLFDKTEGNSCNKPSSFGGSKDRPSERPSGSEHSTEHSGSTSINKSSVKEGSTYSRRGAHSSTFNAQGTNAKNSYTANNVDLVNKISKQSHKTSFTKNSAQKCQYSSNTAVSNTKDSYSASLENKIQRMNILF